jgi:hypothetical protein
MQYWDEMQSKSGFSDGEAVPECIETYRTVYLRVVNRLAEQWGSDVRALAYDRPGMHNWCLIVFRDARNPDGESVPADLGLEAAIDQAHTLDVDDYLRVIVTIDPSFDLFLAELRPDTEGDAP